MDIKFSKPDITELEINNVVEVLKSGWITTGAKVKQLENLIVDYVNSSKCVCLNSQTACAEMALHILGVGEGDEVITTAYTYTATASIVCHVGAKLVLIDTQKNSLEMDYDALERAINKNTKIIIPVDIGGIPCDYQKILEIIENKTHIFRPKTQIQEALGRIAILADTAHAFGAQWHGRMVGSIADFSAFSFHAVKNFTTAEGGALTWRHIDGIDDNEIYYKLQLLSLHGQSKDAFAKTQLGAWEYDIIDTWYKCNMTDIAAAMGIAQMQRYPQMLLRRQSIINKYDTAFIPHGIETLKHYSKDYFSSGHLYMTRIPGISLNQRNKIIENMADKGIPCNVHYKPLPMLTAYKKRGFDIKNFPNAYSKYSNEISLPLHTCLSDEEIQYIIDSYINIVKCI